MGADTKWANPGDGNKTCLHKAAEKDALACVEFLYQNNAVLEARDDDGNTALDLATANGCQRVAARLAMKTHERAGL